MGISVARLRRNKQLQERIGKAHDALRKLEESEPDIWIRPDKDEYAALKKEVRNIYIIHNGILCVETPNYCSLQYIMCI